MLKILSMLLNSDSKKSVRNSLHKKSFKSIVILIGSVVKLSKMVNLLRTEKPIEANIRQNTNYMIH